MCNTKEEIIVRHVFVFVRFLWKMVEKVLCVLCALRYVEGTIVFYYTMCCCPFFIVVLHFF